jgi:hypothetical protein
MCPHVIGSLPWASTARTRSHGMSIPSSNALVLTTPSRLPSDRRCSIKRRSRVHGIECVAVPQACVERCGRFWALSRGPEGCTRFHELM